MLIQSSTWSPLLGCIGSGNGTSHLLRLAVKPYRGYKPYRGSAFEYGPCPSTSVNVETRDPLGQSHLGIQGRPRCRTKGRRRCDAISIDVHSAYCQRCHATHCTDRSPSRRKDKSQPLFRPKVHKRSTSSAAVCFTRRCSGRIIPKHSRLHCLVTSETDPAGWYLSWFSGLLLTFP